MSTLPDRRGPTNIPQLSTSFQKAKTHKEQMQKSAWRLKKKPIAKTYRKAKLTCLTGVPKPFSSICALVTIGLKKPLKKSDLNDSA